MFVASLPVVALGQTQDVTVSPITAYLDLGASSTEYTVQVAAPSGADVRVVWSKPSCGVWSTPVPTLFRWTHEHPPCTDPLLHPDTVISVTVTIASADVEFICRYRGADAGTGKPCERRSLGLTPSPTATTAAPTPSVSPSAAVTPTGAAGPAVGTLIAVGGVLAGILIVGGLGLTISRVRRRRRESKLDPCGPRYRRGLAYLASEIESYAACNEEAIGRVLAAASIAGSSGRVDLGDLWDAPSAEMPAWAGVVGGDGLMRPMRDPDIVAASRPSLGADGPWRAAAELTAARVVRRTHQRYGETDRSRWKGAVDALIERVRPSCASDGAAAAIAANAFALAAIAAADALARMNDASEGSGCPPILAPDVSFATVPADATDATAPGETLVRTPIRGGEPTRERIADAARP